MELANSLVVHAVVDLAVIVVPYPVDVHTVVELRAHHVVRKDLLYVDP
jgi:hypothetical protein